MLVRQNQNSKRAAFTLMEIIAVVTIIMILAGVGVLGFNAVIAAQREKRAKIDCETIQKAAEIWQNSYGTLPQSIEQLTQLQPDGNAALLPPTAVTDPWGQPYMYNPGELHPTMRYPKVYSNGNPSAPKVIANW
jgi:type II secretory pathway pseudopilin PulG